MKNVAIWVSKPYSNDELFNETSVLNRDNCLAVFHMIKDKLAKYHVDCHTQDVYRSQGIIPDIVIFLGISYLPLQYLLKDWMNRVRRWVILQECEVIQPSNWDIARHKNYEYIFTWNDLMVDNNKYIKYNFANIFPTHINADLKKKEKLCTLIAGNKKANHKLELYSKRVEAIRWFENNHPDDFDLYGVGWDEYRFSGWAKALNKCKYLTRLFMEKYPSYKGRVTSKKNTLEKYKFAICYENARDITGYITEKIFDCFVAGCVPVYWGPDNISEVIPQECFIDKREFDNYEELYRYLSAMNDTHYLEYIENIDSYLKSDQAKLFTVDYAANIIVGKVLHG